MFVGRAVASPSRVVHVTQPMPQPHPRDTARHAALSRTATNLDRAAPDRLVVAGTTALAGPGGPLLAIDTGHSPSSICIRWPRIRCERRETSDRRRIAASCSGESGATAVVYHVSIWRSFVRARRK